MFVPAGSAGALAIGGGMIGFETLCSVTDATLFVPAGSETVDRAPQARRSAFWLFPNCTADRSAETVLKEVNPATVLDPPSTVTPATGTAGGGVTTLF